MKLLNLSMATSKALLTQRLLNTSNRSKITFVRPYKNNSVKTRTVMCEYYKVLKLMQMNLDGISSKSVRAILAWPGSSTVNHGMFTAITNAGLAKYNTKKRKFEITEFGMVYCEYADGLNEGLETATRLW